MRYNRPKLLNLHPRDALVKYMNKVNVTWDLQGQLIQWIHSKPSLGHPGILHHNSGTQSILVALFVLWCLQLCQVLFCLLSEQGLQITSCCTSTTPDYSPQPWSHIAMDFITDLPLSRGNTVILTIIDRFSKVCGLIPLPNFFCSISRSVLPQATILSLMDMVNGSTKRWGDFYALTAITINTSGVVIYLMFEYAQNSF